MIFIFSRTIITTKAKQPNNTKGFLTEYSMTTASEDMAEIFSFLMSEKQKLENIVLNDPILNKKTIFLKNAILKIDNNFKFN